MLTLDLGCVAGSIDAIFSVYIRDPLLHRPDAVGAPALTVNDEYMVVIFLWVIYLNDTRYESIVETAEIEKGSSKDGDEHV